MSARSSGAAIVIEASLGYRWIERCVSQSLAVIACVGGKALLQQSEQGPGCLIWLLHAARCTLGECITNSLHPSPRRIFVPYTSARSIHPSKKSRLFATFHCRDAAPSAKLQTGLLGIIVPVVRACQVCATSDRAKWLVYKRLWSYADDVVFYKMVRIIDRFRD